MLGIYRFIDVNQGKFLKLTVTNHVIIYFLLMFMLQFIRNKTIHHQFIYSKISEA